MALTLIDHHSVINQEVHMVLSNIVQIRNDTCEMFIQSRQKILTANKAHPYETSTQPPKIAYTKPGSQTMYNPYTRGIPAFQTSVGAQEEEMT